MEQEKKTRKAGRHLLILLAVAAAVAAVAAGIVLYLQGNESGTALSPAEDAALESTTAAETTAAAPERQTEETIPEETLTGFVLNTPIGTLIYPEEWEQYLDVEERVDGDNYRADFACRLSDGTAHLFTLSVGPEGLGFRMGDLNGQEVWIDVSPAEEQEQWTEEESVRVVAMQERVNDLINQIYEMEGFHQEKPQ